MVRAVAATTRSRRSRCRDSRRRKRRIQPIIRHSSNSSVINTDTEESSASNNGCTTEPPTDGRYHHQPSCSTSSSYDADNVLQPEHRSAATDVAAATFDMDDETRDHGYSYGLASPEMSPIRQVILNIIDEGEEDYNSDDFGIGSCSDD